MIGKRFLAWVQIGVVALLVGYSTYQLFLGRFERSMTVLPVLMGYYLFLTSRGRKRRSMEADERDSEE